MKAKGIVVKIKGSSCIVLLKDGTYRKVPLAGRKNVRVGTEIEVPFLNFSGFVKPALLVASIMIVVLGLSFFRGVMTPEAFAYVSLDINPSIEFEIDEEFRILDVTPVNRDAEKLLSGIELKGEDLYSSINLILDKSAQAGYLKPGQKNYVLSTYTLNNSDSDQPESFAENLTSAIENKDVDIELIVMTTDRALRAEARNLGLSTGKLAVYKTVDESGAQVNLDEVRDSSVTKLFNAYKVHLLPNGKKLIVKSVHIPVRGDEKAKNKDVKKQSQDFFKDHKPGKEQSDRDRQKEEIKVKIREQEEKRDGDRDKGKEQDKGKSKDQDKDNNQDKDDDQDKDTDKNRSEDRDRDDGQEKKRNKKIPDGSTPRKTDNADASDGNEGDTD